MNKLKFIFSCLLMSATVSATSSCSVVQKALEFKVIAPQGGDAISLMCYAEDTENFKIGSTSDCYDAFFSSEYDVIIFSLNKGINLIQENNVPFKLAMMNTYGNAYLVSKYEDDSQLDSNSIVVTYDYAYSKYDSHDYDNLDVQNNVFKYCYNISHNNNTFIDGFFEDPSEEYNALLEGNYNGQPIDYALLPEPYVSKLVNADPDYHIVENITSLFTSVSQESGLTDDGYSHFPQTGIFVRDTWDSSDDDYMIDLYDNFIERSGYFISNLESANASRAYDYLYAAYSYNQYDIESYFGDNYLDLYENVLDGDTAINGVNACGFCSYNVDLDQFYLDSTEHGAYLTNGSIDASTYSDYFE
ncbi:MAG: hypothetical protein WCR63_01625 [Bacilli bacterium]